MSDLGDITKFLKEGNVADLSWLEVDEAEYRAESALPRQNLDIAPDLEAAWSHEDKPSSAYLVPNKGAPRTMGDLSETHGKLASQATEAVRKVARLALVQSSDMTRFKHELTSRFDLNTLRANREVIASVMAERGLLGPYYIDSRDFPGCHTAAPRVANFVSQYARHTPYVVAKEACRDCIHAKQNTSSTQTCAMFHKELVVEVPYTPAIAEAVERSQAAKGKAVEASLREPKERVRLAILAPDVAVITAAATAKPVLDPVHLLRPVNAVQEVVKAVDLTPVRKQAHDAITTALQAGRLSVQDAQKFYRRAASSQEAADLEAVTATVQGAKALGVKLYDTFAAQPLPRQASQEEVDQEIQAVEQGKQKQAAAERDIVAAAKARPIVAFLRREMLKGRNSAQLAHALRTAFDPRDIEATQAHWMPLAKEAGLYGHVYSTQESFDNCHEGADFLARHNPGVKAIVASNKCQGCFYSKLGRCLVYGKPLVKEASELYTPEMVAQVELEYKTAGLVHNPTTNWGGPKDPKHLLKTLHSVASVNKWRDGALPEERRGIVEATAHHLNQSGDYRGTAGLVRREIVAATQRYMNEGLYGTQLLQALKARFDTRDITAAVNDLRPILAEQGLQGIFYVDPSIYSDYGAGCNEAVRLHRPRLVKYAKMGPKCASCVHQTRPGFCTKLAKPLVVEPPYTDKQAQQRAILASGEATEVPFDSLINNGQDMMTEYELQNQPMSVELEPAPSVDPVAIEFNNQGIDL